MKARPITSGHLERIDINRNTSVNDRALLYLLHKIAALEYGVIARIENDCYYLTTLWFAFHDNYIEANFTGMLQSY